MNKWKPVPFLPTSRQEMDKMGIKQLDVIFVTGDAYVDHPSFAAALLGRLLQSKGFTVGIIAQPRWDCDDDFSKLGKPRLCCMVSSGNVDSMVTHYTANLKRRSTDKYSPGGKAGLRPDRALIAYCSRARHVFKNVPIIVGGIEASLRKFGHYDVWSNMVRRSVLLDCKADLLVYGMGELQTVEIADRLKNGESISSLCDIPGTLFSAPIKQKDSLGSQVKYLPSFESVSDRDRISNTPTEESLHDYALAFQMEMENENPFSPTRLAQISGDRIVLRNPPARPLSTEEFDSLYELPFNRLAHPCYESQGGVPGLKEVQFSITSNRGCFGGCSFCAITSHQGRIIQTRSIDSMVKEARSMTAHPDFKGYIHDVGGPTANFQAPACEKQLKSGPCPDRQCMFPKPCPNVRDSHQRYIDILFAISAVPGVKKVFIRSGIRFDYLMLVASDSTRDRFMHDLVRNHVSGQLKVAPEHISDNVLSMMGKCPVAVYDSFKNKYEQTNEEEGKKQYLIPYLIAAHPGSTLQDAIELALYLKKQGFVPDQVQEFYPTPSTVSTCMYFTSLDPRPGKKLARVFVPKGRERTLQRALLQFDKPQNRTLVQEALQKAGRTDLIRTLLANRGSNRFH